MENRDNVELLVSDEAPNVDLLLEEFKQAGTMPNGFYDVTFDEETRRMIWAGQSPDGRRWDSHMPDGKQAKPWNGASDTRVPLVDEICNEQVEILCSAFAKAELRATSVNADMLDVASSVSAYLHWLVHTKLRRQLNLEVELAGQYSREYGWCTAYVGWEREITKRYVTLKLQALAALGQQVMQQSGRPDHPLARLAQDINDPSGDETTLQTLGQLYTLFVQAQLRNRGFYESELEDDNYVTLKPSTAKKVLRDLREKGEASVPFPFLVKNQPLLQVLKPYLEFLAARGTAKLQDGRMHFWRRWMTEAQIDLMKADGWDPAWCEQAKMTKGNISSWAGALGQVSLTGPATKTVGNTTYLKITEENNPLIEVVYGYVRKVDEDGVTCIFETIFSPHFTKIDGVESFAKHGPLNYAHARYPMVELKRENLGRALNETRSVAEIAGTWQNEEKTQRDMLFNRAQWDTLPPVSVPKLGGVDYRLGPAAQVPLARGQSIQGIDLGNGTSPQLAIEMVSMVQNRSSRYFGRLDQSTPPALVSVKMEKAASDFYSFWGEILLMMFSLTLQYNPEEIVRVTGNPALAKLDPGAVMDGLDIALVFDVRELNPDFFDQKVKAMDSLLPLDAGGTIDRNTYVQMRARMIDPGLAQKILLDSGAASQAMWREVQQQVISMAQGNEAEYVENDPTAANKLSYLQSIIKGNPKYLAKLGQVQDPQTPPDERFDAVLQNYVKNLQQSVAQQQNKQIGRIGVKPLGAGVGPGAAAGMPTGG